MDGYMFTALCLAGIVVSVLLLAWFARGLRGEQPSPASQAQPAE
jgi:hypothetical protein